MMTVKFPLLASLPGKEQQALIMSLPKKTFKDGETIIEYGEKKADVYFILSGSTKSFSFSPSGNLAYFKTRHAGDLFGYYSAITSAPRTANIVAIGDTILARISGTAFLDLVCSNPSISRYFLKLIGSILREETTRLANIITLSAKDRLINDLLSYSGEKSYAIPYTTREDFASRLNMTRETLSRNLHALTDSGFIRLSKGCFTVIDRKKLAEETSHVDKLKINLQNI